MSDKSSSLQNNEFKFYHRTSHDDNFYLIYCQKVSQNSDLLRDDHYDHRFFHKHLNNSVTENYYIMFKLISHSIVLEALNGNEIDVSTLKQGLLNLNQILDLEEELKQKILPFRFMKYSAPEKEARIDYDSGSMNSFQDHDRTLVINHHFDNDLHQQNGVGNCTCNVNNNRHDFAQHINDQQIQQQAPTSERISFHENNGMETNYNGGYDNYDNQEGYNHQQQQVDSNIPRQEEFPRNDYAPANGDYTISFQENNGSTDNSQKYGCCLSPNNNISQTNRSQHPQVDQNTISQEMRSTYFPHHYYINYKYGN
jgi:hypothetical protein